MSDQTVIEGISKEERQENKGQYVGKRLYSLFVEIKNELHSARQHGVADEQLGDFADDMFDVEAYIAEARRIGNVPVWNAEGAPVGRKLDYKLFDGAKPVAQ